MRADPAFLLALLTALALNGCASRSSGDDFPDSTGEDSETDTSDDTDAEEGLYALGSVVYTDNGRMTYVQVLPSLDVGHVDNDDAIEVSGNALLLAHGRSVWIGLAEEPTWVRYTVDDSGTLREEQRLSFLGLGWTRMDYGNVIVDDTKAVSVSGPQGMAVLWNPKTMEIEGEIPLGHLVREGYELEVWTTVAHQSLVYIPGRWGNWDTEDILPEVSITILDPFSGDIVGVAQDARCASGGRIVFDAEGIGYVMGDGRNYSWQMYAHAAGEPVPKNCLLRILPGATDFDPDYFYEIPGLTGGPEAAGELETPMQGSGFGFTKMFHPDELPDGIEPVDFSFWEYPVFKTWRLTLADPPVAQEVEEAPFSTLGYEGSGFDGKLYTGESPDYTTSVVYEIDASTNLAREKFTMDGVFYGLLPLEG